MAASLIDQLKAVKAYEARLDAAQAAVPATNSYVRPVYGDPDSNQSGTIIGYAAYDNSDSGGSMPVDASYVRAVGGDNDSGPNYSFDGSKYLADKVGPRPTIDVGALRAAKESKDIDAQITDITDRMSRLSGDSADGEIATLQAEASALQQRKAQLGKQPNVGGTFGEALKLALDSGVDLRPLYGETYADAVQFKQDLGQYVGKDQSMIIPANPVGYGGQFKFDPNFGSTFYRDLAMKSGEALGLSEEQILQKGTEYFADKFASGNTKGVIGFTDFGTGLLDEFAKTAGYSASQVNDLRTKTLKPLYDANKQLFTGLSGAARVESQSSGFFKTLAQDIASNPFLAIGAAALSAGALAPALLSGTAFAGSAIATGAIAGGTMGAIRGIADGDFSSILKNGFKGAIQGAATGSLGKVAEGVSGVVSKGLVNSGMDAGRLVNGISGAAGAGASSAIVAALTGQDVGNSILKGAAIGGLASGLRNPGIVRNSDVGGGIDNSNMDLGNSMNFMDQYTQGAYSGLDGPASDKPANQIDNAMLKVGDMQDTGFKRGVKAALPQLAAAAIGGQGGNGAGAGAGGTGLPVRTTVPNAEPETEAYKGVGLISANAYTRAPQSSPRAAAKFDLQKALANSAFKPGLINGGIYGG